MSEDKIIFADGFYSYDIPDTTPEFVLGKSAIKVHEFLKFLEENKQYAVNGFLYLQTLRSKKGERYTKLDLFSYQNAQKSSSEAQNQPVTNEIVKPSPETLKQFQFTKTEDLPVIQQDQASDMPFGWDDPNSENYIPF